MKLSKYPLGDKLVVYSHYDVAPSGRAKGTPPSLLLICHGFYTKDTDQISVPPNLPTVRFSVPHGQPHFTKDTWFTELIEKPDAATLFPYEAQPGSKVYNYLLGRGAPKLDPNGKPNFSYDKDDKVSESALKNISSWSVTASSSVEAVTGSYAQNIFNGYKYSDQLRQILADDDVEIVPRLSNFDIAIVKKSCQCLDQVFKSLVDVKGLPYENLLCLFCRETN